MVCRHLPSEPSHLTRSVPPFLIVVLKEQHHVHLILELSPVPQRISVIKREDGQKRIYATLLLIHSTQVVFRNQTIVMTL